MDFDRVWFEEGIKMKVQQPFKRFRKMLDQIAQANLLKGVAKELALQDVGEYRSRGKGQGMRFNVRKGILASKRAARKAKNKLRHKLACKGNGK